MSEPKPWHRDRDNRSPHELAMDSVESRMSKGDREALHQVRVFLADLVVRRRVPLTAEETAALRAFADVARATRARDDFGFNPHPVRADCQCGNCRAGV